MSETFRQFLWNLREVEISTLAGVNGAGNLFLHNHFN